MCVVSNSRPVEKAAEALKSSYSYIPEKQVPWRTSFTSLLVTSDKTREETSHAIEALKRGVFQLPWQQFSVSYTEQECNGQE